MNKYKKKFKKRYKRDYSVIKIYCIRDGNVIPLIGSRLFCKKLFDVKCLVILDNNNNVLLGSKKDINFLRNYVGR